MGISIDELTDQQRRYIKSWKEPSRLNQPDSFPRSPLHVDTPALSEKPT